MEQLEYVALESARRLDLVTIDGDMITYETGRARGVVDSVRRRGGLAALRDWTNGYAALRPMRVPAAPPPAAPR